MKKYMGIFIAGCLVLFASSNVYAGITTTAGEVVTITITGSGGNPNLEFEPSPTTKMGWLTTANAFTLVSWSASNEASENGSAYCASSGSTNIYKQSLESYTPIAPTTAGDTLAGFE